MGTIGSYNSKRIGLLLEFMSIIKGRKIVTIMGAKAYVSVTYKIAEKLSNSDLAWLIEQLKERLGV